MRETLVRQQILVLWTITLFLSSLFSGQAIAETETTTYPLANRRSPFRARNSLCSPTDRGGN